MGRSILTTHYAVDKLFQSGRIDIAEAFHILRGEGMTKSSVARGSGPRSSSSRGGATRTSSSSRPSSSSLLSSRMTLLVCWWSFCCVDLVLLQGPAAVVVSSFVVQPGHHERRCRALSLPLPFDRAISSSRTSNTAPPASSRTVTTTASTTALFGIPKMFRWLTDQYPDIVNRQLEVGLSDDLRVDTFYLDMNGIIHPATHGNSDDGGIVVLDETAMFKKIFLYVDRCVCANVGPYLFVCVSQVRECSNSPF